MRYTAPVGNKLTDTASNKIDSFTLHIGTSGVDIIATTANVTNYFL